MKKTDPIKRLAEIELTRKRLASENSAKPKSDTSKVKAAKATKDSSKGRSTWTKSLDLVNDTMTGIGLAPVYGAAADTANAIFSSGRTVANAVSDTYNGAKNKKFNYSKTKKAAEDTAWSLAAMIPIAGQVAGGMKLKRSADTALGSYKAFKLADTAKSGQENYSNYKKEKKELTK